VLEGIYVVRGGKQTEGTDRHVASDRNYVSAVSATDRARLTLIDAKVVTTGKSSSH
jgi:hypothetical protein